MTIALNGFMGCGKSSVGKALAALLSCPLTDLDAFIEEREGRGIPEIFSSEGEKAFRKIEERALREILLQPEAGSPHGTAQNQGSGNQAGRDFQWPACGRRILSLGGGTVTTAECALLVKRHTFCIYLRAGIDTLVQNLENDSASRPMLNCGPESLRGRIEELMAKRSAIYENTASLVIDIEDFLSVKTGGIDFTALARHIAGLVLSF
ncbi:MAG: shikimate kinase [Candidatus Cryptobacteroides sp.]